MHCKVYNKQINQPCLNLFILFTKKKEFLKNRSCQGLAWSSWVDLQKKCQVTGQPVFTLGKKKKGTQVGYFP